jgi:hypothetical protein
VYREFLHVDDMADAWVFVMHRYDSSEILNIGLRKDVTIAEVAQLMKETVGYEGAIVFDSSKPDGTPRKLLDVSRLFALGGSRASIFAAGSPRRMRGSSRTSTPERRRAGERLSARDHRQALWGLSPRSFLRRRLVMSATIRRRVTTTSPSSPLIAR